MTRMSFQRISLPALCVFALGLVLRLIAWSHTTVINPDGALFIHQARALYYGQTDTLFCALNYLASLPLAIAGSYWIFHDWIVAARFVSLVFGFSFLIPLYFLLRRFFEEDVSVLATLVFAVMPVFVGSSVDVIRDPISWFFATLGLYAFVLGLESKRSHMFSWSCLAFMMAMWARVEAALLIGSSLLYLMATRQEHKSSRILAFLAPALGLSLIALVFGMLSKDLSLTNVGLQAALWDRVSSPLAHYHTIQNQLLDLQLHNQYEPFGFFLGEVRKNVWLIALGSLVNRCLEGFFYPFLVVALIGIGAARKSYHSDQRLRYLASISCILFITFYLHIFKAWYLEYRHMSFLIISCSLFIGFGIDWIIRFIRSYVKNNTITYVLVALSIIIAPIYKNMIPRDQDKVVFKNIGEFIHRQQPHDQFIPIATSRSTFRVVSFYANLGYQGAPCPEFSDKNCWDSFATDFDELLQRLKKENIKYLLWEQNLWPPGGVDLFAPPYNSRFRELGRWYHPDTGEMVLFEVT